MLQANIHVEVLDVDVKIADAVLVVLTLAVEVFEHALNMGDVVRILRNSLRIPVQPQNLDECHHGAKCEQGSQMLLLTSQSAEPCCRGSCRGW